MQTLSTTRTAVLLLAVVMVTAGCDAPATGSVGSPADTGPASEAPTSTTTTSTTVVEMAQTGKTVESTSPQAAPQIPIFTTTTSVAALPPPVEDIDSVLDGLDETLAGLDQLLNQAAAALAAEEGEIIP